MSWRPKVLIQVAAASIVTFVAVEIALRWTSPAMVTVGSPVTIAPRDPVAGGVFRNSPAIVSNPAHPEQLAEVNEVYGPGLSAELHWSVDGGRTWHAQPLPIPLVGTHPFDADVAYGTDGMLFVTYTSLDARGNAEALWLGRSADDGRTIRRPTLVTWGHPLQPRLVVQGPRQLFVTWLQATNMGTLSLVGGPNPVVVARSSDGGASFSSPVQVSDVARSRVGAAMPAVASDGTVVIIYEDFARDVRDFQNLEGPPWDEPFQLVVTRSTNGGRTFSEGEAVAPDIEPRERFVVFVPPFASLAAGPDDSLYVVWSASGSEHDQLLLLRSTNAGISWDPPTPVLLPAADSLTTLLPTVAVGRSGEIAVVFLAGMRDRSEASLKAEVAISRDGGHSFGVAPLSDHPIDPRVGPMFDGEASLLPFLGTRLGIAATAVGDIVAWIENPFGPGRAAAQAIAVAPVT